MVKGQEYIGSGLYRFENIKQMKTWYPLCRKWVKTGVEVSGWECLVCVGGCRSSSAERQRNVNSTVKITTGRKRGSKPYMVRLEDGKKAPGNKVTLQKTIS